MGKYRGGQFNSSTFITPQSLKLFAFDHNGILGCGIIRVSLFKIYKNNLLSIDLVPVRVGSIGYMYDTVSGQLFGNDGTGDFILGPDI